MSNNALTKFIHESRSGKYKEPKKIHTSINDDQSTAKVLQKDTEPSKSELLQNELLLKEYHELNKSSLSPKLSLINTVLFGLIAVMLGVFLYYQTIANDRSFSRDVNTFRRYMFDNMLSTFKTSDKSRKFEVHMQTVKKGR